MGITSSNDKFHCFHFLPGIHLCCLYEVHVRSSRLAEISALKGVKLPVRNAEKKLLP